MKNHNPDKNILEIQSALISVCKKAVKLNLNSYATSVFYFLVKLQITNLVKSHKFKWLFMRSMAPIRYH